MRCAGRCLGDRSRGHRSRNCTANAGGGVRTIRAGAGRPHANGAGNWTRPRYQPTVGARDGRRCHGSERVGAGLDIYAAFAPGVAVERRDRGHRVRCITRREVFRGLSFAHEIWVKRKSVRGEGAAHSSSSALPTMTRDTRISICSTLALGALLFATACSDSTSPTGNNGTLVTRLTDAPFPTDQVKSVDVFVVRVDARQTDVTDADANTALDDQSSATSGWKTVARPNKSFDLLSLQNGIAATLGQANLPAGTYSGFRFVIDQSKSSATLKDGTVLS